MCNVYCKQNLCGKNLCRVTYSVPDGVLNGGVGTICCGTGSTEPGGRVRFSLFLDILFMVFVVVLKEKN